MSDIGKLIEAINIPKRIIDGAEKFISKLLGPAITESGQLIADQIRFRKFKNQVTIFTKAKEFLESKQIEPKQINLKVLVPLLEYSSLEEDEKIQNIWSSVIANISTYDTEQLFNLKCIGILKEITPHEIILLDLLFDKFKTEEKETLNEWKDSPWTIGRTTVSPENSVFEPWEYKEKLKMSPELIDLYVDRLISFGLLKFEQPELIESTSPKSSGSLAVNYFYTDSDSGVKTYHLETSDRIHFTGFGLYFVKLCKFS